MAPRHEPAVTARAFILLGLTMVGAEFPPVITYPSQEHHRQLFMLASASSDVILNCDATDADPKKDFIWRRNRTHPLPLGWRPTGATPGNDHSSLSAPFQSKSITLPAAEIRRNPSSLEGSYECVVSNTAGVAVSGPVSITIVRVVYPEMVGVLPRESYIGATLILPCSHGYEPQLQFFPSALTIGIQVEWFLSTFIDTSDIFTLKPFGHEDDTRVIINELGTLYLRNYTVQDAQTTDQSYVCTIFNPMDVGRGRTTVGRYRLQTAFSYVSPRAAKLLYKTPDFNVTEGASFYLYCIYEDVEGGLVHPVFLTPGTASTSLRRGGIYVMNVDVRDSGNYRCMYRSTSASIEDVIRVTVIPYPRMENVADTYAPVGSPVYITCRSRAAITVTFRWFFNDEQIFSDTKYRVVAGDSSSVLSVLNPGLSDAGVIGCTATNEIGTMRENSRFIPYDRASIEMNQVKGITKDGKQYMVFECNYELDVRARNALVYFTISERKGRIDSSTNDELFGINNPAVVKTQDGHTLLQLALNNYERRNVSLNCTCHVEFKILNATLSASATTTINAVTSLGPPPESWKWWMILLIAILIIIMVVLTTILCHRPQKMPDMAVASVVVMAADREEGTQLNRGSRSVVAMAYNSEEGSQLNRGSKSSLDSDTEEPEHP